MSPHVGMLLGQRYRLTDRIAVGGMGEVWRAQDEVLAREVAAKILKPEYTGDAGFLTRFRNEARHTAALAHPNIAAIYDYGETDSSAYLVMELVPGEPLNDLIAREGELPVPHAMRLLAQAAHGLAAAHAAGVVHRDVKPGNLLITPDGRLKVTDFGIARAGDQVALTATGQVMGTAQYLAPEQAMGRAAVPASDVYALGVVAYEMLTGTLPFTGESPVSIALAHVNATPPPLPEWLPPGARALVASSMAKDPAERPADATTFARAAEAVAQGRDADARALLPATSALAGLEPGPETARTQVVTSTGYPVAAAGTSVLPGARGGSPATPAEGTGVGAARTAGPPRRRLTTPLVALLLLVAFVAVGSLLASGVLGGGDDPDGAATPTPTATAGGPTATAPTTATGPTTEPTTTTPPTTASDSIVVDKGEFVGRDRAEVVARLEFLGLRVKQTPERDTDRPQDEVLDLDPTGDLAPGDRVTVLYADPRPAQTTRPTTRPTTGPTSTPTTGGPGDGGDGPGNEGSGPGATNAPTASPTGTAAPGAPVPPRAGDGRVDATGRADGTRDSAVRALTTGSTTSGYDTKDDS